MIFGEKTSWRFFLAVQDGISHFLLFSFLPPLYYSLLMLSLSLLLPFISLCRARMALRFARGRIPTRRRCPCRACCCAEIASSRGLVSAGNGGGWVCLFLKPGHTPFLLSLFFTPPLGALSIEANIAFSLIYPSIHKHALTHTQACPLLRLQATSPPITWFPSGST